MNTIGKHLNLIGILLLTVLVGAAAGLYFDVPARLHSATSKTSVGQQYICPMHPEIVSAKPGKCPKCGMALVLASQIKSSHDGCSEGEEQQSGCCAEMSGASTAKPATEMKLPPGHPPIPGWTSDTNSESAPAASTSPAHSSHSH